MLPACVGMLAVCVGMLAAEGGWWCCCGVAACVLRRDTALSANALKCASVMAGLFAACCCCCLPGGPFVSPAETA